MLAVACGRWCSSACRSRASRCFSDSCHVLKPLAVVWVRHNCCAVCCVPMRGLNVGLWTRCAKLVLWAVAIRTTPWFAMVLAAFITSWRAPLGVFLHSSHGWLKGVLGLNSICSRQRFPHSRWVVGVFGLHTKRRLEASLAAS